MTQLNFWCARFAIVLPSYGRLCINNMMRAEHFDFPSKYRFFIYHSHGITPTTL